MIIENRLPNDVHPQASPLFVEECLTESGFYLFRDEDGDFFYVKYDNVSGFIRASYDLESFLLGNVLKDALGVWRGALISELKITISLP